MAPLGGGTLKLIHSFCGEGGVVEVCSAQEVSVVHVLHHMHQPTSNMCGYCWL